ncbi:MAG: class I SAM-dependent methyltransferase [Kangiellaceae bacterium]|nr:class I SAM-dependent methyltransferase [Kangiellaceae bacterium]
MKTILAATLSLFIGIGLSGDTRAHQRSESDLNRDKSSKPQQILSFAGIKKGDQVLDFLGGGGYYSQLLKERVGANGKVLHHTNKAYLGFVGKALTERTNSGGMKGVTQLISEAAELKLGVGQFDSAILILGYHDFFYTEGDWSFPADQVMPQLVKSLKKGGTLLVIDHASAPGDGISATKTVHRIDEEFVKKDLRSRGFKFVKESDILRNPKDSYDKSVFAKELRRKTDRFVFLFEKI